MPIDLATAEHATFLPFVGQSFQVSGQQGSVSLELFACRPVGARWPGGTRDPFALDFKGTPGLRIPQGIYRFEHPDTGPLDIFIVQVADGPNGSEFEALFN